MWHRSRVGYALGAQCLGHWFEFSRCLLSFCLAKSLFSNSSGPLQTYATGTLLATTLVANQGTVCTRSLRKAMVKGELCGHNLAPLLVQNSYLGTPDSLYIYVRILFTFGWIEPNKTGRFSRRESR